MRTTTTVLDTSRRTTTTVLNAPTRFTTKTARMGTVPSETVSTTHVSMGTGHQNLMRSPRTR